MTATEATSPDQIYQRLYTLMKFAEEAIGVGGLTRGARFVAEGPNLLGLPADSTTRKMCVAAAARCRGLLNNLKAKATSMMMMMMTMMEPLGRGRLLKHMMWGLRDLPNLVPPQGILIDLQRHENYHFA